VFLWLTLPGENYLAVWEMGEWMAEGREGKEG
jgi:hypothetical protein